MLEQLEFDFKQDSSFICPFCVNTGFQTRDELFFHLTIEHPIGDKEHEYVPNPKARFKTLFMIYNLDDPI